MFERDDKPFIFGRFNVNVISGETYLTNIKHGCNELLDLVHKLSPRCVIAHAITSI